MNLTRRELFVVSAATAATLLPSNNLSLGCNSQDNCVEQTFIFSNKEYYARYDKLNECVARNICITLGVEYNKHNRLVVLDKKFYTMPVMFKLEELLAPVEDNFYIKFSLDKYGYLVRTYWYSKHELMTRFNNLTRNFHEE